MSNSVGMPGIGGISAPPPVQEGPPTIAAAEADGQATVKAWAHGGKGAPSDTWSSGNSSGSKHDTYNYDSAGSKSGGRGYIGNTSGGDSTAVFDQVTGYGGSLQGDVQAMGPEFEKKDWKDIGKQAKDIEKHTDKNSPVHQGAAAIVNDFKHHKDASGDYQLLASYVNGGGASPLGVGG